MHSFIFNGEKINLSIWFDTITIYEIPHANYSFASSGPVLEIQRETKLHSLIQSRNWDADGALGVIRYVQQSDHGHVQYHQDGFGAAHAHYHVQFRNPIRLTKLQEILDSLSQAVLLTDIEQTAVIFSYQDQNAQKFAFTETEQRFDNELLKFGLKVNSLKKAAEASINYKQAYKAAASLHQRVSKSWDHYLENRNLATYKWLKRECSEAIALARPELEKYRGYKEILWNIALFVSLLGLGYLIAGCINLAYTDQFMFFRTDSAEKLHQLESDLQDMTVPAI